MLRCCILKKKNLKKNMYLTSKIVNFEVNQLLWLEENKPSIRCLLFYMSKMQVTHVWFCILSTFPHWPHSLELPCFLSVLSCVKNSGWLQKLCAVSLKFLVSGSYTYAAMNYKGLKEGEHSFSSSFVSPLFSVFGHSR